jgi:hypothetical protein
LAAVNRSPISVKGVFRDAAAKMRSRSVRGVETQPLVRTSDAQTAIRTRAVIAGDGFFRTEADRVRTHPPVR